MNTRHTIKGTIALAAFAAIYVPLDGLSHFAMRQDPERRNTVLADFLK